ncbi:cytochrome c oxidase subunit II [Mucisphaera calidilacus]|uniref:Cytochrome c oxidase subunit 2 n=1 Tax=Mucisphaera calidilacus TaxID=2527982 RepID=A0A518C0D7_9BACT|nr:cytochrome c oxidase subunit II [Mucisphaera calidilacus]QDU72684.1 Cytochrome c oxidase subunit 2 precursor [Mucisphaera calidilacus]
MPTLMASTLSDWLMGWMPKQASTVAGSVDTTFYAIYWVSVVCFLIIGFLMFYFAWRYRQTDRDAVGDGPSHSTVVELLWTAPPVIAVLVFFTMGFVGYRDMAVAPSNTYQIVVTGFKWGWLFQYPNGVTDQNLYVPADRPVELVMQSSDVIHSVFIPDFRVKKDCVPGRYNKLWFETSFDDETAVALEGNDLGIRANTHNLFCTEYCGNQHSQMLATVYVLRPADFAAWLESAADIRKVSPAEAGAKIASGKGGCLSCHSLDGTSKIGPSFKDLYGKQGVHNNGSYEADENYIRESIIYPGANIVNGYQNVMPSYKGRLSDLEITAIIEYLKTISENYQGTVETDWDKLAPTEGETETQ